MIMNKQNRKDEKKTTTLYVYHFIPFMECQVCFKKDITKNSVFKNEMYRYINATAIFNLSIMLR